MNIFALALICLFSFSLQACQQNYPDTCRVATPSPKNSRPSSPANDPCAVPVPSPKDSPRK